ERWKATRSLMLFTSERGELAAMELTYTYEGLRSYDGRQQAVIGISGQAKGKVGQELRVSGSVNGSAHYDVAAGQVARAEVKGTVKRNAGEKGQMLGTLTTRLERTVGSEVLNVRGRLDPADRPDSGGRRAKAHTLQMVAGQKYTLSLESPRDALFDP